MDIFAILCYSHFMSSPSSHNNQPNPVTSQDKLPPELSLTESYPVDIKNEPTQIIDEEQLVLFDGSEGKIVFSGLSRLIKNFRDLITTKPYRNKKHKNKSVDTANPQLNVSIESSLSNSQDRNMSISDVYLKRLADESRDRQTRTQAKKEKQRKLNILNFQFSLGLITSDEFSSKASGLVEKKSEDEPFIDWKVALDPSNIIVLRNTIELRANALTIKRKALAFRDNKPFHEAQAAENAKWQITKELLPEYLGVNEDIVNENFNSQKWKELSDLLLIVPWDEILKQLKPPRIGETKLSDDEAVLNLKEIFNIENIIVLRRKIEEVADSITLRKNLIAEKSNDKLLFDKNHTRAQELKKMARFYLPQYLGITDADIRVNLAPDLYNLLMDKLLRTEWEDLLHEQLIAARYRAMEAIKSNKP